jgi:hypothetical protein
MPALTEDTRISFKLPVLVAIITAVITSTVSMTGGYMLIKGRLENVEAAQLREAAERDREKTERKEADAGIYVTTDKAEKRISDLEKDVRTFVTTVSSNISAMQVKQAEDGKKLDLLVNVLIAKPSSSNSH